jgi:molybdopterin-guanine dinucleotide biosynthesis protein A
MRQAIDKEPIARLPVSVVILAGGRGERLGQDKATLELGGATGVLAGIAAGLTAARHAWSFVVACDMPFVNPRLVRYMFSQRAGYDIIVPHVPAGLEPLHALYHRRCRPPLHRALLQGQRRVISFYASLRVRYIEAAESEPLDPRDLSFFNINTPEDLVRARSWLDDS